MMELRDKNAATIYIFGIMASGRYVITAIMDQKIFNMILREKTFLLVKSSIILGKRQINCHLGLKTLLKKVLVTNVIFPKN
jgi:hypothetical protein